MLAGLLAAGLGGCAAKVDEVSAEEVFDSVIRRLRRRYYDQAQLAKLDVAAYRAKLPGLRYRMQLYWDVLGPMLREFHVSHLGATPPRRRGPRPPGSWTVPRGLRHAIGATIAYTHNGPWVTHVRPGSLAFEAGVAPGWRADGIEVTPIAGGAVTVKAVFSPPGGDKQRFEWTVAADAPLPPPAAQYSRSRVGDVELLSFNRFLPPQVDPMLVALETAGSRPVILDLRRNTGGMASQCRRLAGVLLPPGTPLGVMQTASRRSVMTVPASGRRFNGPLAVLIGRGSGSAAEVLACALQEHGRARLFGDCSGGAVLVANKYGLPDGGELTVPFASYLSAHGVRLEGVGVTPDVGVVETREAIAAGRDLVVEAAQAWLASRAL